MNRIRKSEMTVMKRTGPAAVGAVILAMVMSITVYAAALSPEQAERKALKDAGLKRSQVCGMETELEGKNYDIEFRTKKKHNEYDYEIDADSGIVREAGAEYTHKRNTSKDRIGKKAALRKVADFSGKKLSVVSSGTCRYKKDDGEWIYEVKFRSGHYKYEYDVLAPTGKIIEMGKDYRK